MVTQAKNSKFSKGATDTTPLLLYPVVPQTRGQYFLSKAATRGREPGPTSDAGQCVLGPVRNSIPIGMHISKENCPGLLWCPTGFGEGGGRGDAPGLSSPGISRGL